MDSRLRLPTSACNTVDFTGSSTTVSDDDYDANRFGDIVNRGGYGLIRRVSNVNGRVVKMIKLIPTDALFQKEVQIMESIEGCSNVVQLITWKAEADIGYIYMKEYDGDLKQLLDKNQNGFKESVVKSFIKQLFTALNVCQDAFIVHGDVKPENILIDYHNDDEASISLEDVTLSLADFGSAMRIPNQDLAHQREASYCTCFRATRAYQAPESLECHISSVKTDAWAAGVTMYQLMTGRLPPHPVREIGGRLDCGPQSVWTKAVDALLESYSERCCEVLRGLLTIDAGSRLSSKEALGFTWFESHG